MKEQYKQKYIFQKEQACHLMDKLLLYTKRSNLFGCEFEIMNVYKYSMRAKNDDVNDICKLLDYLYYCVADTTELLNGLVGVELVFWLRYTINVAERLFHDNNKVMNIINKHKQDISNYFNIVNYTL